MSGFLELFCKFHGQCLDPDIVVYVECVNFF